MEQPRTECPFCGNVWQEHTLTELNGCEAIMKLEYYQALAGSDGLQGQAGTLAQANICCPVCGKLSEDHAEADLRFCVERWRKRERGATGLDVQSNFIEAHFANEEPDPVKRAKLHGQLLKELCSCGKVLGSHTPDELTTCFDRRRREGISDDYT